jgi:hypothetical protein
MSDDVDPKALLSDLEQLSKAGRDCYLKLLPAQDVVELLKEALDQRDEARNAIVTEGNYIRHSYW